ncbi:MAG: phosphocholine cytidylyltransferase family protein [candidate division Zixibacteria bacterium]|nr:phosphocholine cytidylyltransferase family protein [candidate division Zixibacteria bacterium]
MYGIIIGAGRGRRLMPLTEDDPKCFAVIGGRRILDWALEAFRHGGIERLAFVGGYRIDRVQAEYPHLRYFHNDAWERNNILASLFYAEPAMEDGFVCSYADILYRPSIVRRLLDSPADIALAVDTAWRERYTTRTQHPEHDAEKVVTDGGRLFEIGRHIRSEEAHGEYIGVARFTPAGARLFRSYFHRAKETYAEGTFRSAVSFQKAYLIELFQEMLEDEVLIDIVPTEGDYMEIDTTEDYHLAQQTWRTDSTR